MQACFQKRFLLMSVSQCVMSRNHFRKQACKKNSCIFIVIVKCEENLFLMYLNTGAYLVRPKVLTQWQEFVDSASLKSTSSYTIPKMPHLTPEMNCLTHVDTKGSKLLQKAWVSTSSCHNFFYILSKNDNISFRYRTFVIIFM